MDSVPDDVAAINLADLARINRFTGARRHLIAMLRRRFAGTDSFRFLDVGAASGDLALAVDMGRDADANFRLLRAFNAGFADAK